MTIFAQIKGLFSPQAVALALEQLPPQESAVINTLFPNSIEHPFVHIGIAELENVVGTQPVVRRDGQPIPFQGKGDDVNLFAPRPIKPSIDITASDINDLKAIWGDKMTMQRYVARQVDKLRRLVRNTTEAMASVAVTTGRLAWPSRLEGGGFEVYELDFGGIKKSDPPTKWDAENPPSLSAVYKWLSGLRREVTKNGGGGGKFKFLAGEDAFAVLLAFAETWKSTTTGGAISLTLAEGKIIIGGFEISELSEEYQSPVDGQWAPKVPPKCLLGYSSQRLGKVFYLAIDSISNNGAPAPFYVATEAKSGDTAISLIAQAKPLPVPDMRAMILSEIAG